MSHPAERPLVTFFVMAYNQEDYMRAAIEGAFAQTYEPLEIILSDDASTDATYRIMEEMSSTYEGPHRIILNRNPENLGIMAHVNRIMELASGALIVLGAGDDISEPHRVARLAEAWEAGAGQVKAVHSSLREIDAEGRPLHVRTPNPWIVNWPAADPGTIIRRQANCTGATQAWSREVFDRFGPIPADRAGVEDGPIFFRAALLGDIAYIDEPLVRQRIGGLSSPARESAGHRYLLGHRIKKKRWWLINYRSFLKDMERIEFPDIEFYKRYCESRVREYEFELPLAEGTPLLRIATLPSAFILSIRYRDALFFRENIKYIFAKVYIFYYNIRAASK